jgi:galactoside O-acetyltransferase
MSTLFGPTHYTEHDLANEGFKHLGSNVRIAKNCTIIGAENISIGDNVRIDACCTIVAPGQGYLNLGSYIHIGGYCALLAGSGIIMEDFSGLSWGCQLYSRSDDYSGKHLTNPTVPSKYTAVSGGAISLAKHVIVGAGSVILPKVTLGEGVAVGALSLVSKDLEPWGIYSGVPVKRIKNRKLDLLALEQSLRDELKQA